MTGVSKQDGETNRIAGGLFPTKLVVVEEADPRLFSTDLMQLYGSERRAVELAVDRRKREFIAGRKLVRMALMKLGYGPCAVPAGDDRAPVFPKGIIGSISHTANWCVVALARYSSAPGPIVQTRIRSDR